MMYCTVMANAQNSNATKINNIWYLLDGTNKTATVTWGGEQHQSTTEYTGIITIPSTVGKSAREWPPKPKQFDPLRQNMADPLCQNNIDPVQRSSTAILIFDFKKGKATSCFAKVKAKWNTLRVALTYCSSGSIGGLSWTQTYNVNPMNSSVVYWLMRANWQIQSSIDPSIQKRRGSK